MILSVSRKTDIPAFYSAWFYNRVKEGFCYTQNPMNAKQVSKVLINSDLVDGIVFWTKNPTPMLERLKELKGIPFYFQYSLNSYSDDMESSLLRKKVLIETFQKLSDKYSPHSVIWRYDPILLNEKYTLEYHFKHFETIAKHLQGYTNKVVISYIDFYDKITSNCKRLGIRSITLDEKELLAQNLSSIAQSYGFRVESCSEDIDLSKYNIEHSRCIDDKQFELLTGSVFSLGKDKAQRKECGCVESVDIGMYNSCMHGCQYCYASYSKESVLENIKKHDKDYPLLIGKVDSDIVIKEKKQKKFRQLQQLSFADI